MTPAEKLSAAEPRRLRVYYLPNLDGEHAAMVAAANQKEACGRLNTTVGDFRRFGGRRLAEGDPKIAVAVSEPDRVWYKLIDAVRPHPWLLEKSRRVPEPPIEQVRADLTAAGVDTAPAVAKVLAAVRRRKGEK